MMTMKTVVAAAIYCRRSTEQGVAEESRSVVRQEALARKFADEHGWTVRGENVYVDDGITGAEFDKRPGLQALRAAARRGEFRRLIVSEQKSLGRESFGVGALIKELAQNGVEVWSYMEARSLTPKNAMDKRIARLTDALVAGGALPSVLAKLREFETKKTALVEEMAANRPLPMPPRSMIEDRLAEWRRLLRQSAKTGRVVLDRVLNGRIVFTPACSHEAEAEAVPKAVAYEFECPTRYDRLFSGVVIPQALWDVRTPGAEDLRPEHVYYRAEDGSIDVGEVLRRVFERANLTEVSSPTGFEPVFWP